VADSDKLSYRDAVRKVTASSLKTIAKTNEIASKSVDMGSPITSARPIGINTTVKTAVSNEEFTRLEAKLGLVLTQIGTLSTQFGSKISALRQEVSDRYKKLTDDLKEDAVSREKYLDAKLQVLTSNVANQQEQLDILITDMIHLADYISTIEKIDFHRLCDDQAKLNQDSNILTERIAKINEEAIEDRKNIAQMEHDIKSILKTIQRLTRIYDANFDKISEAQSGKHYKFELRKIGTPFTLVMSE